MNKLNDPQPAPTKNQFPAVWDLVYADIIERDKKGEEKYGTRLQAFNGRKTLTDAYQEALDLVVYLRQAIFERDYLKAKDFVEAGNLGVGKDHIDIDGIQCGCPVCKEINEKITESEESIEMKYCSCPGAVEIYLAADDLFRCRSCEKRIVKSTGLMHLDCKAGNK